MILGYEFKFHAAHHLEGHETCGKIHGHTYKCVIEVEGLINPKGFVIDFKLLKKIIEPLLEELDHTNLDNVVQRPTAEHLSRHICTRAKELLQTRAGEVRVVSITLWETDNCYVKTH